MAERRRRSRTLVQMAWRADPRRFRRLVAVQLVRPASQVASAIFVKFAVDAAVDGSRAAVVVFSALVGLAMSVQYALTRLAYRHFTPLTEQSTALYDRSIMSLAASIPGLEHMENPAFYNRLELLRTQPQALGQNGTMVLAFGGAVLQTLFTVAVLGMVEPMLLVLPALALPAVFIGHRTAAMRTRAAAVAVERRRIAGALFAVSTDDRHADEVSTLRVGPDLAAHHDSLLRAAHGDQAKAEARAMALDVLGRLLIAAGYIGAVLVVVWRGLHGSATAGDLLLTIILAVLISNQINLLIGTGTRLLNALDVVGHYLWLVDHAAERYEVADSIAEVPGRLSRGITFRDVTFTYPGTEAEVLRGVDLELRAGSLVGVVGENGAGKSTLVKLLTGMYQPTYGSINIDGTDLSHLSIDRWRGACSAAFQDFARFELTFGQGVGVGHLPAVDHGQAIESALRRAGAEGLVSELPHGLDTNLGASFANGLEISGGQWQKIALGRAMMRAPLLLILDEPAASLDPLAEQALFDRYAAHARATSAATGAITFLISHRFGSVRLADQIIVLDEGTVRESGTHAELVAAGGLYAELFELQAAAYR